MGQQMTALRMNLDALRRGTLAHPELTDLVARATRLADDLDHSVDFLTWELRPAGLELLQLPSALDDLVHTWSERFGIIAECDCVVPDDSAKLPIDVTVNLYRIAQEALHNIYKHAGALHVRVMIEVRKPKVLLIVEDDGKGFDVASAGSKAGVGLIGMRERTLLIGGTLEIESTPGQGTSVLVRVPLTPDRTESGTE
jgi:signal transduction histidine kinase